MSKEKKSVEIVKIANAFSDDKERATELIAKIASKLASNKELSEVEKFMSIMITFRHELANYMNKHELAQIVNDRANEAFAVNTASDFRKSVSTALNISNQLFNCRNSVEIKKIKTSKNFAEERKAQFFEAKKTRSLTNNLRIIDSIERVKKNFRCELATFRLAEAFISFCDENLKEAISTIESAVIKTAQTAEANQ